MPGSTDEQLLARLLAELEQELEHAIALRARLHAHPELAHAETWTAQTIDDALPRPGERVAGTGRALRVGEAGVPAVAVRAELDAVPVRERTGAAFAAGGEAMHACGHDVHMAALVALARAAERLHEELPAPLLALFQPSEEAYPSGAQELVEGDLRAAPLRAVVAAHVHPELPWRSVALDGGVVNASCDAFEIELTGESTHGAYPHLGRDPVLAIAEVVLALHARAGRVLDPLAPASLSVGVIEAAGAENVIPASARARGALRAHGSEERVRLRRMLEEVAHGIAQAHGCSARVGIVPGEPPLENDATLTERARVLLARAGFAGATAWRSCGSDDFSFFGALAPLAMAFVGLDGAPGFTARPLHHPELLVPDEAVALVARAQAALYVAAAGR
jgi:amidohydrolase